MTLLFHPVNGPIRTPVIIGALTSPGTLPMLDSPAAFGTSTNGPGASRCDSYC